jgi:hypothetical protein
VNARKVQESGPWSGVTVAAAIHGQALFLISPGSLLSDCGRRAGCGQRRCRPRARRGRTTHRRCRARSRLRLLCPSRGRRGPCANAATQARARWRHVVMIGVPNLRLQQDRLAGGDAPRRDGIGGRDFCGIDAVGLTNTSTSPFDHTPSKPKPSLRQRFQTSRRLRAPSRDEQRAASQTSSHAAARSTPCR